MIKALRYWAAAILFAACAVQGVDPGWAQNAGNPFGLTDIIDPFGQDVQRIAARLHLDGALHDRNASQWAPELSEREGPGLDGRWFGRWEPGTHGMATIKVIENRLYVLYTDEAGRMTSKTWLLEARMLPEGRLVGRWTQVGNPRDTGPFVGRIVDDERIDGIWSSDGRGRWDFRRRLRSSGSSRVAPPVPNEVR